MILHSLRVTHWRNLLNPTEVGPFADGLNVIHAPNGTGKSSLFEAMRRTLFDAHLVTGKEIEAVRPWGRSLAPQVMVDFSQAGVRYQIEKTFLDSANARLLRFEEAQFVPLADGRNADSKLREILSVTDAPGRGLSKQEHWGLAQVLWAPQGSLNLRSLSSSVSENLRTALGVQLTGEGGTGLEELLRSVLVAPDDKAIRDVRKHLAAREKAETTLQASLIRLTVRPLQATTATRKSPAETKAISAGEDATFTGSPEVSVSIEGFGSIHAAGPEMDVDDLRDEVTEANKKLTKLTQPYGTQNPDRLQLLRDQAKDLDQKIETLKGQIEELLGDETMEDLQGQVAELDARILERTGRFPVWKAQPPALSALQSAMEEQRKEIETAVVQAEDAFDQAQAGARAVEKRHTETEAGLKNARLNLEAANGRLTDLTRDGLSDDTRQTARQEALMAWEAARYQAKDYEGKLAEIGEDPQKSLEKLERQFQAQEATEAAARDDENKAEGRLQTLTAEGAYSKLATCDEKLADLNDRIGREKLRMDALRLLHDTVASCKAAAVAAVAAPVERVATRMLARVAGPRLGTIRLTDQFVPAGIQPEALTEAVELDNLSGGEQEQLFLITRLALGQVLAKNERQLVVLDDVLNATDTGRLARMLTLLEEAADSLQIVILTCHPERYRALERAEFFHLSDLLSAEVQQTRRELPL